jgi:hypothetical protein
MVVSEGLNTNNDKHITRVILDAIFILLWGTTKMKLCDDELLKECTTCKKRKPRSDFNNYTRGPDGKQYSCRECQKKYKEINKLRTKIMMRKLVERTYFRHWSTGTINSHRYRNCKVDINLDDLENLAKSSTHCKICGVKLSWEYGNKKARPIPSSPTLDRIDNDLNLNINNVQIICHDCNSTKRSRTMKEFYDYCKMITEKFGDIYG